MAGAGTTDISNKSSSVSSWTLHPKVVSERLGHPGVGITLDTYSHAIPAMQEDAAARVAALLEN